MRPDFKLLASSHTFMGYVEGLPQAFGVLLFCRSLPRQSKTASTPTPRFYILQRGVQWKQGVVIYMALYTSLLYNTTPIHCTPLRLHPLLQSIQRCKARNVMSLAIVRVRYSVCYAISVRPISLLALSLLTVLDSNFPGNSLWAWEFHPFKLRLCSSQTL